MVYMRNTGNTTPGLAGWAEYLAAGGRRAATIELRLSHIRRFERSTGVSLDSASDSVIIGYLSNSGWAPSTRRSVRSSIKAYLDYLGRPVALPVVRVPRGVPRPAGEQQIIEALSTAPRRAALAIELMSLCGLRRAEACRVHSRDLTRDSSGWWLRVAGKGGVVRLVPVPPHLALDIEAARGWVFPGNMNGHLAPASLGKIVSRALPAGITPHQLRHRYATMTYARARDIRATQELLGHARLDTTMAYVAVADTARRAAATAAWRVG